MTDFASLVLKVDSTQIPKAEKDLERLTTAGQRAEKAADSLSPAMQRVTASAGAQRAGMQQLSFQIGDVSQQFALGARPMTIFAQQSGQVIQAVQMMSGSTKGFIGFLAGPWGAVLTGAVTILGSLAAAHFAASDGADKQKEAAEELTEAIDELNEAVKRETRSQEANTQARIADAFQMRIQTEETLKLAKAELTRQKLFLRGAVDRQGNAFTPDQYIQAESEQARSAAAIEKQLAQIEKLQGEINKTDASIRGLQGTLVQGVIAEQFDKAGAATGRFNRGISDLNEQLQSGKITLQEYAARSRELRGVLEAEKEAIQEASKAGRKSLSEAEKAARKAAREYKQLVDESTRHAEALEDQAAKFGKSALEIHRMEVAAKAAAAPTAQLAERIRDAGKAVEGLMIGEAVDDYNKMIKALKDEQSLLGLTGKAREIAALQLEKEGKMAEWAAQGLTDLDNKWMEYAAARMYGIEQKSILERDLEAARDLTDQMDALISGIGRMSGMGFLGDVGRVLTARNPIAEMLSMGGVGTIAGSLLGGDNLTEKMGAEFTKSILKTFPDLNKELAGNIGGTFANILQGAGTGAAIGGILGGGKAGQLGSTIGGALGQAAFKEFAGAGMTKALGAFGGPLASIAGGILGNVIGKALSGNEKGRAAFSGGSFTVTGDNAQRESAANDLAKSVTDALKQIGDAFGAEVGSFTGMIGVRNSSIRYDAAGQSLKKGANFGQDSAAAIAAAISDAISDGVFTGLSDGVERLLKNGGDLETQLQKALSFQGVFDELKQMKDPQGAALDDLAKWHDNMASIFAEAGATSDQLAQLEELTGLKRKDIVEKYGEQIADAEEIASQKRQLEIQIMQLEGDTVGALAAARAIERGQADASLRPLYDRIYALQDEQAAAQKAAEERARIAGLAASERELAIAILELEGRATDALTLRRQAETAAADASLAPLYARKYALEDEAAATAKLNAIADERYGLETQWLQLIGDTASLRARELAQLDPSNRALQQQIWSEQDRQAALEQATAATDAAAGRARELADAQKAITDRYADQIDTLRQTADTFRELERSIGEFRRGVMAETNPAIGYAQARSRFLATSRMAGLGNENSLQTFAGQAQTFLDLARGQAGSYADYQRAVALVTREALKAEHGAGGVASAAERQASALQKAMAIETAAIEAAMQEQAAAVNAGIDRLGAVQTEVVVPQLQESFSSGLDAVAANIEAASTKAERAAQDSKVAAETSVLALNRIARLLARWDRGEAMAVVADETVAVTVTAYTGGTVPVEEQTP